MRHAARSALVSLLDGLARGTLKRAKPTIVAITGSVGKTSTKELAAGMLAVRYRVRKTEGNYNTEIGVPLTVLGERLPRFFPGWVPLFFRALGTAVRPRNYPEVLVLELAADHPGDLKHLTKLIRPDVAVVTNVRNVHREFYASLKQIADEKAWAIRRLKSSGTAVLNADDPRVRDMRSATTAKIRYFGSTREAHLRVLKAEHRRSGYRLTIAAGETDVAITTNLHSEGQFGSVLGALGAALALKVPMREALQVAGKWMPPPGRLRVLQGKDNRLLLDDTYNASPEATIASLEALQGFPRPRRAVLGDMKELGDTSVAGHKAVGTAAAKLVDELVVVGEDALVIAQAAREAGLAQSSIHVASNAEEALKVIKQDVGKGGTMLFKGSQSVYLERAVAGLLANPADRKHLLQRLRDPWHRRNANLAGDDHWSKR